MFSGVRRLISASYLFSVGVDGLLGVVLCCLLWMVCLRVFLPFVVWFVVVGWKIPAFLRTGYIFKFEIFQLCGRKSDFLFFAPFFTGIYHVFGNYVCAWGE